MDQRTGNADTVLVGDAGGYVDPIYGEGLFFAVTSGIEAAKALISAGERKDKSFRDQYLENMAPFADMIKKEINCKKCFSTESSKSFLRKRCVGRTHFCPIILIIWSRNTIIHTGISLSSTRIIKKRKDPNLITQCIYV